MSLEVVDLSVYTFKTPDLLQFMVHMKLIEKASLDFPIIISKEGQIVDGRHRLCKAILL